jgi:hypothetical protein
MANGEHFGLLRKRNHALERPHYEPDSYVCAAELDAGQRYRLERAWHHNRFLHGEGVVCGLQVVPARIGAQPWAVRVCPGYAIGCCGEELEVRSAVVLDVREAGWDRPTDEGRLAPDAFIAIAHAEELVKPRPTAAAHCGCEDTAYEPSRARDGYRLAVLWSRKAERRPAFDICVPALASCPVCSGRAYVLLARVTLPEHESDPIASAQIDNTVRQPELATSVAQRQLLDCCCDITSRRGQP